MSQFKSATGKFSRCGRREFHAERLRFGSGYPQIGFHSLSKERGSTIAWFVSGSTTLGGSARIGAMPSKTPGEHTVAFIRLWAPKAFASGPWGPRRGLLLGRRGPARVPPEPGRGASESQKTGRVHAHRLVCIQFQSVVEGSRRRKPDAHCDHEPRRSGVSAERRYEGTVHAG